MNLALGLRDVERAQEVLQKEQDLIAMQAQRQFPGTVQEWAAELVNIRAQAEVQAAEDEVAMLKQRAGEIAGQHVQALQAKRDAQRQDLLDRRAKARIAAGRAAGAV